MESNSVFFVAQLSQIAERERLIAGNDGFQVRNFLFLLVNL